MHMIYALLLLYLCVCMCPHIIEVKRVYGVYQYIFSCEESALAMHLTKVSLGKVFVRMSVMLRLVGT